VAEPDSLPASSLWRVAGALAVVGALLALGRVAAGRFVISSRHARRPQAPRRLLGASLPRLERWLGVRGTAGGELTVVARRRLGPREAICLIEAGSERFLVGASASGVSLLARLPAVPPAPREAAEPEDAEAAEPGDFAEALADAAAREREPGDVAERLARSRERLERLALACAHEPDRREGR
jgi:hypothetical protein